jgi:hypothetical protein
MDGRFSHKIRHEKMSKKRKVFDKEFKLRAVQMSYKAVSQWPGRLAPGVFAWRTVDQKCIGRASMIRVNGICEGETEERFAKDLLAAHLFPHAVYVNPILLGRGNSWHKFAREVIRVAKCDHTAYTTTMIVLYGMSDDFPGYEEGRQLPPIDRVAIVENKISQQLALELPEHNRLRVSVQLHEFVALLFAHPESLSAHLRLDKKTSKGRRMHEAIAAIRSAFDTPEHVNVSSHTAPAKRILGLSPGYGKVADGFTIAKNIDLEHIRAACPHFTDWLGTAKPCVILCPPLPDRHQLEATPFVSPICHFV